jgi:hypothetical protein
VRKPIPFRLYWAVAVFALLGGECAKAQETGIPEGHPPLPGSQVSPGSGEITISLPHLLIEAREEGTRSLSAYVLTAPPGIGEPGTAPPREFIFALPEGATAPVRVQAAGARQEFSPDRIRELPDRAAWAVELPPWEEEIQVTVEALSPLRLRQAGFKQRFFYPVTNLTILVRPADLVIAGKGLQFAGAIEPMQVSQWISPPIEAGGFLDLHIHEHEATTTTPAEESDIRAMPNRMTMPKSVLLLVFVVLVAFAVAVSARRSA